MKYTINTHYNRELISEGILAYWKESYTKTLLFSLGLMVFVFARILVFDINWANDVFLWLSTIPLFFCVGYYFVYRNRSLAVFEEMETKNAELTFSDEGYSAKSDTGFAEIKWKMFKSIIKTPNTWVFVYKNNSYNIFPLADIPDEVLNFISGKVVEYGGQIK